MPGDFIFGDNDGVQLIPRDLVDEVLLRVEVTFEKENAEREQIAAGMPSGDGRASHQLVHERWRQVVGSALSIILQRRSRCPLPAPAPRAPRLYCRPAG
jgi:hypothetical protein